MQPIQILFCREESQIQQNYKFINTIEIKKEEILDKF